jgi:hypothetical protein
MKKLKFFKFMPILALLLHVYCQNEYLPMESEAQKQRFALFPDIKTEDNPKVNSEFGQTFAYAFERYDSLSHPLQSKTIYLWIYRHV